MLKHLLPALALMLAPACGHAANLSHSFTKIQATDQFWAEGAHFADFNKDGHVDVVSGPFWYVGPDFKKRHEIYQARSTFKRKHSDGSEELVPGFEGALGVNNAYSDCFLTFTYDFNDDGWMDVIVYGFPGKEVPWYENPKGKPGLWPQHVIFDVLDNESPEFVDVTGDGKPEILCCSKGFIGYAEADWTDPASPWTFRAISPPGKYERYTHGIGCGDVNGDGRNDILEKDAWWEQPESLENSPVWKRHDFVFAPAAAQMYAYDVNGDKLNDVITAWNAHEFGLVWWEQVREGDKIDFKKHPILNSDASTNKFGVQFSQPHALILIDMNRDGLKDIVTGKRFWAHGKDGPDPQSDGYPSVLYWFELTRPSKGQAEYIPHLIDDDSGVGTQVAAGFISNKEYPDVVVGNKKGVFILQHKVTRE